MSYGGGGDDDETLKLRVVYEAQTAVKDAIAGLRELKERTGELSAENEKLLQTLEYQKTLLEGAGTGLDHYTELVHEEAQAQKLMRQALEESTEALDAQATVITSTAAPAIQEAGVGFDVLARNAFQAERVFTMMSGGAGLARAGPMLERLVGALGGPAGLGFALIGIEFGLEKVIPLVEKLFGFSNTAAMKESAEYWERIAKAADQLAESKTKAEKKTAGEINEYVTESNAQVVRDAITRAVRLKAETTRTPEEQALMDAATPETGMTGAIAMHPMLAYRAVQSRANIAETIKKQSDELFTQIAHDPSARARVAQMATDRPGDFPPSFAAGLRGFSPEGEAAGDQEVEDAVAFGDRAHKAGQARRAHAKQQNAAAKDTAHGAAQRYAEEQRKEREAHAEMVKGATEKYAWEQKQEHDQAAAEGKAEREKQKADREHDRQQHKFDREHTPQAMRRARGAAEHEAVAGYVEQANERYGFARNQGQLEEVTRAAVSNVKTGQDIGWAVQNAVTQTQEKIQRDFMRTMGRQYSGGQIRGE